ncbi:MAG: WYL domain-containing protein [Thermoanaerobaculum sp.]|nr:WYL domain-containing protein [Thermoanaerobaculum sp.]MDW7968699.1 WYL domain-containing protein [Thermoanaerobaculum sp.]
MVFANALSKAARLVELQILFARSPSRSFRTEELATKLGVAPRTVRQYLSELSTLGKLPVYHDGKGWRLVPHARLETGPFKLELAEATAVYLASRLLLRHSDEPNPPVRDALRRLALVVPESMAHHMDALLQRTLADPLHPFAQAFRVFAYGWALNRVVECQYHPLARVEPFQCRFHPYLLEPALWGMSFYAVGFSELAQDIRIFKLERVLAARLTEDTFLPADVTSLLQRLEHSWDVWLSEEADVEVRLLFQPAVARIMKETIWHPSQKTIQLQDGSVQLTFHLVPNQPFVNWILSWGPQCEVLHPPSLRQEISQLLSNALARYTSHPESPPAEGQG